MDARHVLESCSFFARLDPERLALLASRGRLLQHAKGETIFCQGEPVPGLYVLGSGLVRVYQLGANGREHVLHLIAPGATFAEVAVLGDFPAPATAQACRRSQSLLIPAAWLRTKLREDHQLCLELLSSMAFTVKRLVGQIEGIVLRDAAGRVAHYLLLQAVSADGSLELPSRKKDVASHLHLTSETLSRTLRQLQAQEVIETRPRQRLAIRDRKRLLAIAEGSFPKM
jgi:CRP/FNR family transcriptional regulator